MPAGPTAVQCPFGAVANPHPPDTTPVATGVRNVLTAFEKDSHILPGMKIEGGGGADLPTLIQSLFPVVPADVPVSHGGAVSAGDAPSAAAAARTRAQKDLIWTNPAANASIKHGTSSEPPSASTERDQRLQKNARDTENASAAGNDGSVEVPAWRSSSSGKRLIRT